MSKDLAIYEYQPQGAGHIIKLCCLTAAGFGLVSLGGSVLFGIPLGAAVVYSMFRGTGKAKEPAWIHARDEIWDYKLSPKHKSLKEDYKGWCDEWGKSTINSLIEPMIGNCHLANFVKDKKHPYHGLRGVIVYDHQEDDLPPLTPHDYVKARLQQRLEALDRSAGAIDVDAQIIPLNPDGSPLSRSSPYWFLTSLTQAPLQPLIIAGVPGSGKGVMAAMALSLGVRDRGLRYWVFNPKNKLEEAGYWIRAEKHFLKNCLQDDPNLFDDLMNVLDQFADEATYRNDHPNSERSPFILLIQEINAITGTFSPKQLQIYKAKVTGLASLVRGCDMAIWFDGQSITLKDLGLTGKSNRSMFTAIVALASDRAAAKELCTPLGIPYEPETLKSDERYWLTGNGAYPALPAPPIPTFTSWADVPNLIDLRPGAPVSAGIEASVIELDELLMGEALDPEGIDAEKGEHREQLEKLYQMNLLDSLPTDLHRRLAEYIQSKREFPTRKIQQNWGADKGLKSDDTNQLLADLLGVGLIETFSPDGVNQEWIRWIG